MTRPSIGMPIMLIAAGFLLAATCLPAQAQPAAPDILKQLEGNWKGKGKMKAYVDSAPEPVSCSSTFKFVENDENKMQLQLACASLNAKSHLVAFFDYGANSGALKGSWFQNWSTSSVEENGSFDGRTSQRGMTLDVIAGGKKRAEIQVKLNGARSHQITVVGYEDGKPTQSSSIDFRR